MADEFHTEELRSLCCAVLILKNRHEVFSRVGDMSRTLNHLFDVINMSTQIDAFDVDISFKQCETCRVRGGEKNSMSKDQPKSIGMWDISNIPFSNQYYSF